MFEKRTLCPHCNAPVVGWETRCPRCHYHPDAQRTSYNRAEDDVALLVRYRTPHDGAWKRHLAAWMGRVTGRNRSLAGG